MEVAVVWHYVRLDWQLRGSDTLRDRRRQAALTSCLQHPSHRSLDVPLILSLIQELATYEKAASSVLATEASLLKTLSFPSNPSSGYAKTLLLFAPDPPSTASHLTSPQCAGMALYFTNYSTWRAAPGIYLEDLFVRPEYRGRGYGKRLLQELAKETKRIGGERLEWSVLKWNEPSIKFYKAIGAHPMDEWVGMRVDDEALDKMAGSTGGGGLERMQS